MNDLGTTFKLVSLPIAGPAHVPLIKLFPGLYLTKIKDLVKKI